KGILRIENLSTSCGCAPAKISQQNIASGESSEIAVSFHSRNNAGTIGHMIQFDTNDPAHQHVTLTVSARSQWPVEASPNNILSSNLPLGETQEQELTIYSADREKFSITSFSSSHPLIQLQFLDSSEFEHRYRLTIKGDQVGPIVGTVNFKTDNSARPVIVVPVRTEVVLQERVFPKSILLGQNTKKAQHDVTLIVNFSDPLNEIIKIGSSSSDWSINQWRVEKLSPKRHKIVLSLNLPDSPGYHRNKLELNTKLHQEIIAVNISCLIVND
ncbi:MAG: DUF1573 domain-containing protein, partial [Planctomycetaceae bacterium]|nr:DUF1573 domain-containing protein [Planctomycetaceae bacterium]